jgi:hypothetical protein
MHESGDFVRARRIPVSPAAHFNRGNGIRSAEPSEEPLAVDLRGSLQCGVFWRWRYSGFCGRAKLAPARRMAYPRRRRPIVIISGSNTGLSKPIGTLIDSGGNLYVANCSVDTFGCPAKASGKPSIEEFAPGSDGNVASLRMIAGKRTQLIAPFSVAVRANGDIYVLDNGDRTVSTRQSTSFVPTRTAMWRRSK